MTETPVKPLQFKLMFRKEVKHYQRPKVGKSWGETAAAGGEAWGERDDERFKSLPDTPKGFTPMIGAFPAVSSRADFLNLQQMNAGMVDWFFFAEAVPVDYDPLHCVLCKRMAARDALEE